LRLRRTATDEVSAEAPVFECTLIAGEASAEAPVFECTLIAGDGSAEPSVFECTLIAEATRVGDAAIEDESLTGEDVKEVERPMGVAATDDERLTGEEDFLRMMLIRP